MDANEVMLVLEMLGIDTETQAYVRKEGQIQCTCPLAEWFHEKKTDNKPSMSVGFSPDRPTLFKCFACAEKGKLWQLVDSVGALSGNAELQTFARQLMVSDKPTLSSKLKMAMKNTSLWVRSPKKITQVRVNEDVLRLFPRAMDVPTVRDYLHSREVTSTEAEYWGLRFDQKNRRIVFPVRNGKGHLVGAVGRIMPGEDGEKYWNYFGFQASYSLGGEQHFHSERSKLLLIEGYFCLMRACKWAEELDADAACTFHAEVSEEQADKIIALDKGVICCYDPDKAGNIGWNKAKDLLAGRVPFIRRASVPIGQDMGSMTHSEFHEALKRTPAFGEMSR